MYNNDLEVPYLNLELITESELHEMYNDMLDECFEPVMIGGHKYCHSDAFRSVDPVAYQCGFNDWLDYEVSEGLIIESGEEYYRAT